MRNRAAILLVVAGLGGCSHKPAPPPPPPPAPVVSYAPMPVYATPGMVIPARLPDGGYPTPNRGLTGAAALWHLRAALNVAALSCPGEQGVRITAAYNGWITAAGKSLAAAHKAVSQAPGFDDAQTRLYNFYAQLPARPAFCAAAETAVAGLANPAQFDAQAPATLAALDRAFTDFYRAYDAWRNREPLATPEQPRVILAAVAQAETQPPAIPVLAPALPAARSAVRTTIVADARSARPFHRIEVDPSLFRE